MPRRRFVVLLSPVLFLSGCLYSVNPLYTEKDILFMPDLIGKWQHEDTTITFAKSDEKAYSLVVNEEGTEDRLEAHLVKLGELLMLDTYPDNASDRLADDQLLPVHSFKKIEVRPDILRFTPWNFEYLDGRLRNNKLRIANVRLKDAIPGGNAFGGPWDAVLLTGTTTELQKKLREIENDPEIFSEKDTAEYRRQE